MMQPSFAAPVNSGSGGSAQFRGALLAGLSSDVGDGVINNWLAPQYDTDNFVQTTSGFVVPAGVSKVRVSVQITTHGTGSSNSRFYIQKNGSVSYPGEAGHRAPGENLESFSYLREQAISGVLQVSQGDQFSVSLIDLGAASDPSTWFQIEVIE